MSCTAPPSRLARLFRGRVSHRDGPEGARWTVPLRNLNDDGAPRFDLRQRILHSEHQDCDRLSSSLHRPERPGSPWSPLQCQSSGRSFQFIAAGSRLKGSRSVLCLAHAVTKQLQKKQCFRRYKNCKPEDAPVDGVPFDLRLAGSLGGCPRSANKLRSCS